MVRAWYWHLLYCLAIVPILQGVAAHGAERSQGKRTRSTDRPLVDMVIEKRGTIRIEMLPDVAPKTTAHFLQLVGERFYDGLLFHRVEGKFVAQAGDPASRKVDGAKIANISSTEAAQRYGLGQGGSGKTVPLEAVSPCARGTLGLARSMSEDSGDSQFFFNISDNHRLDNQYTVFGRVVKGLDVMDSIRQGDRIKSIRRVVKSGRSKLKRQSPAPLLGTRSSPAEGQTCLKLETSCGVAVEQPCERSIRRLNGLGRHLVRSRWTLEDFRRHFGLVFARYEEEYVRGVIDDGERERNAWDERL